MADEFYPRPRTEAVTDQSPRCECGKMLAFFVTRPWSIRCRYCRKTCSAGVDIVVTAEPPPVRAPSSTTS